jgi:hypothetical protein
MIRKIFFILFIAITSWEVVKCQPIVNRANSSITVQDARLAAQYNLFVPRYADTTAANAGTAEGIDTLGAIIYTYDVQALWVRKYDSGKKWAAIGGGGGGSGTVTNIATGLGLSGGPITTTGTLLVDTASASILSRQRAANTYQPIGSYVTSNIYTDDGTIDDALRTVELNGNAVTITESANQLLYITDGQSTIRAFNPTDGDNIAGGTFLSGATNATATLKSSFNNDAKYSEIVAFADVDSSVINYTSDRHRIIGGTILYDLRGNGSGVVGIDNNGLLSWSAASGSPLFPTTGTGTATGAVIGELGGNTLSVQQGGLNFFHINPASANEQAFLRAINSDETKFARFGAATTSDDATATVIALRDGVGEANITALVDASSSSITHTADSIRFVHNLFVEVADSADYYMMVIDKTTGTTGKAWWPSGGAGANTALSNLAAVAINTSLLPASDDAIDLGDDTHRWRDIYVGEASVHIGTSTADEGVISYNSTTNVLSLASTGVVSIPSPFTLGATSVTTTGTQLNYLSAATGTSGTTSSNIMFSAAPTITGTLTAATANFSGFLTASAGIAGNGTAGNSNMYVTGGITANRNTVASLLPLAAAGAGARVFINGTTAYTMTASDAFGVLAIGTTGGVTEAASGTHPLVSSAYIRQLTVTNGAGATDIVAGLYIEGAPTGITPATASYGIWLDAGQTRLDGNLLVGGAAAGTSATSTLALFNGTVPGSSPADGIQLYAEDVAASSELKVRDEAGNILTLSPHNFTGIPQGRSEDMAWALYAEKDGTYINVDMLKLARLVEKLTGEKLVYKGATNNKPNPQNK